MVDPSGLSDITFCKFWHKVKICFLLRGHGVNNTKGNKLQTQLCVSSCCSEYNYVFLFVGIVDMSNKSTPVSY